MTRLWGGRFVGQPDPRFLEFQRSLPLDHVLFAADCRASVAWAMALAEVGVLKPKEAERIAEALEQIGQELVEDPAQFGRSDAEDVHAFIEAKLVERVGDLGKRLHTGRSRNDQVATDLKLLLRDLGLRLDDSLQELQTALLDLAETTADLPMPGYTHLQRAQPITAGHHALAYVEMFARDRARLIDAVVRMNTCPLGSGALAGTAYPVDRETIADNLDFQGGPTRNSLDAVSDRDHMAEILFTCALMGVHLSRLAEDWIFFATHEAGLIELSDAISTGSSLMPQKKNPDGFELLRGKSGRAIGELTGFLATLKGLPLAYDKDLQEDKQALVMGVSQAISSVQVASVLVKNVRYVPERCRAAAAKGGMNATDLADLLVKRGVPFRVAHERAGEAVRAALERKCELEELPKEEAMRLLPELAGVDLAKELSVDALLARRDVIGGTAPERVRAEIARWRDQLNGDEGNGDDEEELP